MDQDLQRKIQRAIRDAYANTYRNVQKGSIRGKRGRVANADEIGIFVTHLRREVSFLWHEVRDVSSYSRSYKSFTPNGESIFKLLTDVANWVEAGELNESFISSRRYSMADQDVADLKRSVVIGRLSGEQESAIRLSLREMEDTLYAMKHTISKASKINEEATGVLGAMSNVAETLSL